MQKTMCITSMHRNSIRRADLKQQNMLVSILLSSTRVHATCVRSESRNLGRTTTSDPLSVILAKMKHSGQNWDLYQVKLAQKSCP